MARKRTPYTQKENAQKSGTLPYAHASKRSGLASQPESLHHEERFHHFLRALARALARADHSGDD